MKWTVFMPVLNEAKIIESKLEYSLEIGRVVVVEGSIPQTYNVNSNGLSSDGTSEILESYSDRITYIKAGKCRNRETLQNYALLHIHKYFPDTEILHRTDADEFISFKGIEKIDHHFDTTNDWMIYTDLINLVDGTMGTKNIAPSSTIFPFEKGLILKDGMYHERFYRYRADLLYRGTAHALSDSMNRYFVNHPDYYFHRHLLKLDLPDIIYHYKYIDGFDNLLKSEMSYLVEDEQMIPNSEECFEAAKERLKNILCGETVFPIPKENHCKYVLNSSWFKYDPIKYDFNINYDEFIAKI